MKTLDFQIMVGELKKTTKRQARGVFIGPPGRKLCDATSFCSIAIGYMAVFPEQTTSSVTNAARHLGLTEVGARKLIFLNDILGMSFRQTAHYMEAFPEDFITEGQALPVPIDGSEKKS